MHEEKERRHKTQIDGRWSGGEKEKDAQKVLSEICYRISFEEMLQPAQKIWDAVCGCQQFWFVPGF